MRIPGSPFLGTIGLSPGHELLATTTAREQALIDRGGLALPPSAAGAVPADPRLAEEGLRTIPPREQAGNVDIKQLGQGAVLLIPVDTPAPCSRPATRTSPRATARPAAPRSR